MKKIILNIAIVLACTIITNAQNPIPAKEQTKSILIINSTAHIGNGNVIDNAAIGIVRGKITLVKANDTSIDKTKFDTVIDAKGKQIYPGLIALNTDLGINEIEAVRATNDFAEVGSINPSSRSIIAYNTDSKITPTVRSNGIMLAQIVPLGGIISGTSSVVELDAWNWEDAAYLTDDAIHLNWPDMRTYKFDLPAKEEEQKERTRKALVQIENLFREAFTYSKEANPKEKNLNYESMRGLFNGSKKLYIHCDYVKEIIAAINLSNQYKMKMVLVGGSDAWMITDLIKENHIPVVLGRIHSLPYREDEDVLLPYKLPKLLLDAGIDYCLTIDGFWQNRNLAFNAGTTVAYGITKEQALQSITINAAKILGIDKTVGTIEEGKDATIIISTGDVLDMKSNNIEMAFIRGKHLNLDNIQTQLYKKYKGKYGLK